MPNPGGGLPEHLLDFVEAQVRIAGGRVAPQHVIRKGAERFELARRLRTSHEGSLSDALVEHLPGVFVVHLGERDQRLTGELHDLFAGRFVGEHGDDFVRIRGDLK